MIRSTFRGGGIVKIRKLIPVAVALALVFSLMVTALPSPVLAQPYQVWVDDDAPPSWYTDPTHFDNIKDAINAVASARGIVYVAAGTYYENNINLKSGVQVLGAGASITTIDGGAGGSVFTGDGVDSAARVDGFTITNGNAGAGGGIYLTNYSFPTISNCTLSSNSADIGGGMFNSYSSPMVTNCTFSNNSTTRDGGGILNNYSSPTVTNCTFSGNSACRNGGGMDNSYSSQTTVAKCVFSGNSAGYGAGISISQCSPIVTNCIFYNNSAAYKGGGILISGSSPAVTDCTFYGNSSTVEGGGIYSGYSSPVVTNCTFYGNSAGLRGGGMYNWIDSWPTLTSCTFYRNSAGAGGGIYDEYNFSSTVTNCILWQNGDDLYQCIATYSDIEDGDLGVGNISQDPLFVDPAAKDIHLQKDSPCIDVGSNSAPAIPDTDFEGDPRIVDGNGDGNAVTDMGVDEYVPPLAPAPQADFNAQPVTGAAPLTVRFTDESTGTFSRRQWDFGDGNTSDEQNPIQRYLRSGRYTVTLKVSGRWGTDTEVKKNYIFVRAVVPEPEPAKTFTTRLNVRPTEVVPNQNVRISVNVVNNGGTRGSHSVVLYINGNQEDSRTISVSPGASQTVTFTVAKATPGTYEVVVGINRVWFTVVGNPSSSNPGTATGNGGPGTAGLIAIIVAAIGTGIGIFLATRPREVQRFKLD